MASIFKRKGRRSYLIEYTDAHGRRRTTRGYSDRKATEAKARRIETRIARGREGLTEPSRSANLAEKLSEYTAELEDQGRAPRYIKAINRLWTNWIKEFGWKKTSEINTKAKNELRQWLRDHPTKSPQTRNAYLTTAIGFAEWLAREEEIEVNPFTRIKKFQKAGIQVRARRAYTIKEFLALCQTQKRGIIYKIAGLSGLRRTEIALLEKRDARIDIAQWHLRPEAQKSKREEIVQMLPEAKELLEQNWNQNAPATERLFPRVPDHRTLDKDLKAAGIQKKDETGRQLDFHALRYFFCTQLARRMPIQLVSKMMRHRDIKTTCNLYLDLGLTDLAEITLKMPRILQ